MLPARSVVRLLTGISFALVGGGSYGGEDAPPAHPLPTADGYSGIWYMNQPTDDAFRYKYSGGFATYPQQHVPIAIHSPEANKTFFVYGGARDGENRLLHMISYFDHETGTVPRPRILLDKQTSDAHDNPTLSIDLDGYLWIFSNAHGTSRPSYIHKSVEPYSIEAFEKVSTTNFSYGQPWHLPDHGFLFLHTRYQGGDRCLYWMTSPDGRSWSEPTLLAHTEKGHYQVSWSDGNRVGTAFNMHPEPIGLNARTNLYYLESPDGGQTWRTASQEVVAPPLTTSENPALVHDYQSEGLLVYLKDVQFDEDGNPVVLYLTSKGFQPGPENGPYTWRTARWTGTDWELRTAITSDHNYDFGSLYLESNGRWRLIAPSDPGPQPFGTGGEIVLWESTDQGAHWERVKALTSHSQWNHTYVRRPVNAHPDFRALWADGDAREPSGSRLYYTDRDGSHVWRLPTRMDGETARPEIAVELAEGAQP